MSELKQLVETINHHEALNNKFFETWMSKKLSLENISIFTRNYWEWTYQFPQILAGLIYNTECIAARAEYTKTLFSEMGNGLYEKVHSKLYENFNRKLAERMGKPGSLDIIFLNKKYTLLPETEELILWQKKIYLENYAIASGAHLALEWQAYTMITKLYEGARNYISLFNNLDEFHEACEFFYVHICSAEKDHKQESIEAASKLIENGAQFKDIKFGFEKNLELIRNFWNAIQISFSLQG